MTYERIFGISVAAGGKDELLSLARKMVGNGGKISTVNPEILNLARSRRDLYFALRESVNIPDGIGVCRALRNRGLAAERLPGVELGELLLGEGVRFAVIGGRAGVASLAAERLAERHEGAVPVLSECGYAIRECDYIDRIKAARPSVVFVCLGTPRQELFIRRAYAEYPAALYVALGGSADVYSGRVERAPAVLSRAGLEWLWRTAREPKRVGRVISAAPFFYFAEKERFLLKSHQNHAK